MATFVLKHQLAWRTGILGKKNQSFLKMRIWWNRMQTLQWAIYSFGMGAVVINCQLPIHQNYCFNPNFTIWILSKPTWCFTVYKITLYMCIIVIEVYRHDVFHRIVNNLGLHCFKAFFWLFMTSFIVNCDIIASVNCDIVQMLHVAKHYWRS